MHSVRVRRGHLDVEDVRALEIAKSYRLINFLNQGHSSAIRWALSIVAWLGCLVCSGRPGLAVVLSREFRHGDLKAACRRAGWIARVSWMKTSIVSDPFYIFSEHLTLADLHQYEAYLRARKQALPKDRYDSCYLMILGQKIHLLILQSAQDDSGAGEDGTEIQGLIQEFKAIKARLVEEASFPTQKTSRVRAKTRAGDFCRDDAICALRDFADFMPISSFPWYVVSGTLLGLYRDQGFMAHDYDIDLGINYEQIDFRALIALLKKQKAFAVNKVDYHIEVVDTGKGLVLNRLPALIKLVHHNGINVDVFIHHLDGDQRWHGSSIHRWNNTEFALVPDILEGVEVLRPEDAERYLTENYGDWRTPVTDFNCSTDTPNLTITNNFLSHALFVMRMLYHAADGVAYNKKVRRQLRQGKPVKQTQQ